MARVPARRRPCATGCTRRRCAGRSCGGSRFGGRGSSRARGATRGRSRGARGSRRISCGSWWRGGERGQVRRGGAARCAAVTSGWGAAAVRGGAGRGRAGVGVPGVIPQERRRSRRECRDRRPCRDARPIARPSMSARLRHPRRTARPTDRAMPGPMRRSPVLPPTRPPLELLLASDRRDDVVERLHVDETRDAVPSRERAGGAVPMLPWAPHEVTGDANVDASRTTGEDVHAVGARGHAKPCATCSERRHHAAAGDIGCTRRRRREGHRDRDGDPDARARGAPAG